MSGSFRSGMQSPTGAEAVAFARDARGFVVRARRQMEEGEGGG